MKPYIMQSSDINGRLVCNREGNLIGQIKDLMIDLENGEVLYAVLSFENLRISTELVYPVPIQCLTFSTSSRWVQINADDNTLRDAPGFDKHNWPIYPTAQFIATVYNHYGYRPRVYIS